jgi:hypothetical protein
VAVSLTIVAALVACQKSKPSKIEEAPTNAETPTPGPSPLANRTRIALPPVSGKPPIKTTGVLDQEMMNKIGEPSFEGWEKIPHGGLNGHVQVRHETKEHPIVRVEITIDPCKDACTPMELAKWQDSTKQVEIKTKLLTQKLAAAPDTVWDLGQTQLNGVTMIYAYGLGQVFNNGGVFANMYALFYNDGVNEMRVIAQYSDDPMRDKELMATNVPREMLERLAKTFMDVYGQIW